MAQPFDFNALLQNPAFMFGSSILSNPRAPNAIGNAFSTVQKLREMQDQRDFQKAQIQNMEAQRSAENERARIAQSQYERQQQLADQQLKQQQVQDAFQQRIMRAMEAQGLLPPEAAPNTPEGGASGTSANYNIGPDSQPNLASPQQQPLLSNGAMMQRALPDAGGNVYQGPAPNYPIDSPRDIAGPLVGEGRRSQFGQPSLAPNARPMRKTRYGTPSEILDNLMQVESSGNPNAVGPVIPGAGDRAMGAFQFRKGTVDMLNNMGYPKFNPFDPAQARDAADFYLSHLVRQNNGNLPLALAQYGGHSNPDSPEAQRYVQKSMGGPIPAGSVQPPVMTPSQPDVGQRAVDIGQLGMLASLGGLKGGPQIMEFGKMLQPQTVQPGTYERNPATGQRTFIRSPYEEERLANEGTRIDLAQKQQKNEDTRTSVAVEEKNLKANAARETDVSGYQDLASSMDRLYTQTDELLRHPGLSSTTGLSGVAKLYNLTPSGRDASALLDSVTNKMVIDTMLRMKALSKTGSTGFGQLSEKEGTRLETYVANLSKATSLEARKRALKDIKDFALQSKGAFAERIKQTYGSDAVRPPPPAAAPPAAVGNVMSLDDYISKHKK